MIAPTRILSAATSSLIAAMGLVTCTLAAETRPAPIPRIVQKDGRHALLVDGAPFLMLGGFSIAARPATLAADQRAFRALMRHLRETDGVFPSNALPSALTNWAGTGASILVGIGAEHFHAWSVASYVGQVAAAGKAVYPLPL